MIKTFILEHKRKIKIIGIFMLSIIIIISLISIALFNKIQNNVTDNTEVISSEAETPTPTIVVATEIPANVYDGWNTVTLKNLRISMKIPGNWSVTENDQLPYTDAFFSKGETKLPVSLASQMYGFDEYCVSVNYHESETAETVVQPAGELVDYKVLINGNEEIVSTCYYFSGKVEAYMTLYNEYINLGDGIFYFANNINREDEETLRLILQSITFKEDKTIVRPTVITPVPTTVIPSPTPFPKYTIEFNPSGAFFTSHYFNEEYDTRYIPKWTYDNPNEEYSYNVINIMIEATVRDEYGNIFKNLPNKLCVEFSIGIQSGATLCLKDGFFVGNSSLFTNDASLQFKSQGSHYTGRATEVLNPIDTFVNVTAYPTILCTRCAGGVVYNNNMELVQNSEVKLYKNTYTWNQSMYLPENKLINSELIATTTTNKYGRFMFRNLEINTYNNSQFGLPKTSYTIIQESADMKWTNDVDATKLILNQNKENGTYYFMIKDNNAYQQMGFKLYN